MHKHKRPRVADGYRARTKPFTATELAQLSLQDAIQSRIPLVYCIARSRDPFVVKIGTTKDLRARLRKLNASAEDILCLVQGGRREEQLLHFRFQSCRISYGDASSHGKTEHFAMSDDLAEWINQCRQSMNLEPLALRR